MRLLGVMIRLALFFLSSFGYWQFLRKKTKVDLYFLPALTVVSQITLLFFAGLFNCLRIGAVFLWALGIVLAVISLVKDKWNGLKCYVNCGYLFLAAAVLLIAAAVKGTLFTHYDNFSHWALVVKNMLDTNRFPNFQDYLITFQSYPLGSAAYIYYFCRLVSDSESMQMLAQGYMMLSFLLPLFRFVKGNRGWNTLFLALLTNFLLCFNMGIYQLLVDTLLPLAGMAALVFLYCECLHKQDAGEENVPVYWAIPFLCAVMQIKNSSIFFAAIGVGMILLSMRREKKDRRTVLTKLAVCASPFAVLILWQRHCGYVFVRANTTKHAMTLRNLGGTFLSKSLEDMKQILLKLASFTFRGKAVTAAVVFLVVLGLVTLLTARSRKKVFAKFAAAGAVLYLAYMVGMALMYLCSMPLREALTLAGFGRYRATVLIAVYYLLAICVLQTISAMQVRKTRILAAAAMVCVLTGVWNVSCGGFVTIFQKETSADRTWLSEAVAAYGVPEKSSYVYCIPAEDAGFTYFMGKYVLLSDNISVKVVTDKEQLDDAQNAAYLLIRDAENPIIQEWVQEHYPDQAGEQVVVLQ